MPKYTSTGYNDNRDVDRDKNFDWKRDCISRFLCCHLPNFRLCNTRPRTQTYNDNSRKSCFRLSINDDKHLCDAENTNSLDTMNTTASPKKTSFLARMKTFITTHKGEKGQKDPNSTHNVATLVPPRTNVGWKHKISLLLSLAMKNRNGSYRMNTKYSSQIRCLILENQKKLNETTQPFNIPWPTSRYSMINTLQNKLSHCSILFQTEKQGNSSYVKPAAHIRRRRRPSSFDELLKRYSQFMSLNINRDEDDRSCNGHNKIQMIFFKKFRSLTHDWFRTVYSESMLENEDKNIGLLTCLETSDTEKNESSIETFPEINVHEMFEEAETEIISDDQILSQLEDRITCTTEGFQGSLKEESHNHESNMLMEDQDHHHLSCSSESNKNSNLKYVTEILLLSGILENDSFKAWHSLEQPLDPEMFEDIESSKVKELSECSRNTNMANCSSRHRKLLFDLTNEVLVQIYDRTCTYCPRYLTSKCSGWIKPFPVGNHLLKDVLDKISIILANLKGENALDIKMERDLDEDVLQFEIENVAFEVEDFIFDRLVDEELSNICKS